jgi:uncharacterized protein YjbI with pentapeptide repeats
VEENSIKITFMAAFAAKANLSGANLIDANLSMLQIGFLLLAIGVCIS